MLRRIAEIGASFDWISPSLAIIQKFINGPSHTFLVPDNCGWSGLEIERMLASRGVHMWGKMVVNKTFMFTVRQPQARWAEHLLRDANIPMVNRPVQPAADHPQSTRRKAKPKSLLQTLDAWLDKLA